MRRRAEGPASSQSLWLHDQDEVMPHSPPRAVPAWRCPLGGSSGPRCCQSQGCPSFPFPSSATPAPAPFTPHPMSHLHWVEVVGLAQPDLLVFTITPDTAAPQTPNSALSHPAGSQRQHTPHAGWRWVLYTKVINTVVPPAGHRGSQWPASPLLGQKAMGGPWWGGDTTWAPGLLS